jgi:hypothetical protein
MATLEAVAEDELVLTIALPRGCERHIELEPWRLRLLWIDDDTLELRAHRHSGVLLDPESTPC